MFHVLTLVLARAPSVITATAAEGDLGFTCPITTRLTSARPFARITAKEGDPLLRCAQICRETVTAKDSGNATAEPHKHPVAHETSPPVNQTANSSSSVTEQTTPPGNDTANASPSVADASPSVSSSPRRNLVDSGDSRGANTTSPAPRNIAAEDSVLETSTAAPAKTEHVARGYYLIDVRDGTGAQECSCFELAPGDGQGYSEGMCYLFDRKCSITDTTNCGRDEICGDNGICTFSPCTSGEAATGLCFCGESPDLDVCDNFQVCEGSASRGHRCQDLPCVVKAAIDRTCSYWAKGTRIWCHPGSQFTQADYCVTPCEESDALKKTCLYYAGEKKMEKKCHVDSKFSPPDTCTPLPCRETVVSLTIPCSYTDVSNQTVTCDIGSQFSNDTSTCIEPCGDEDTIFASCVYKKGAETKVCPVGSQFIDKTKRCIGPCEEQERLSEMCTYMECANATCAAGNSFTVDPDECTPPKSWFPGVGNTETVPPDDSTLVSELLECKKNSKLTMPCKYDACEEKSCDAGSRFTANPNACTHPKLPCSDSTMRNTIIPSPCAYDYNGTSAVCDVGSRIVLVAVANSTELGNVTCIPPCAEMDMLPVSCFYNTTAKHHVPSEELICRGGGKFVLPDMCTPPLCTASKNITFACSYQEGGDIKICPIKSQFAKGTKSCTLPCDDSENLRQLCSYQEADQSMTCEPGNKFSVAHNHCSPPIYKGPLFPLFFIVFMLIFGGAAYVRYRRQQKPVVRHTPVVCYDFEEDDSPIGKI
eukprot:GEMP01022272.1.p1 GENE.GEMP01022272.1~~GEMP01022272.1.p1  ORF type:complete len:763 (-),score=166.04 GEMP01022272.1:154-2442(-)